MDGRPRLAGHRGSDFRGRGVYGPQPLAPDVVPYRPIVMAFLIPLAAGLVGAGALALRARRLEAQSF